MCVGKNRLTRSIWNTKLKFCDLYILWIIFALKFRKKISPIDTFWLYSLISIIDFRLELSMFGEAEKIIFERLMFYERPSPSVTSSLYRLCWVFLTESGTSDTLTKCHSSFQYTDNISVINEQLDKILLLLFLALTFCVFVSSLDGTFY